MNTKRLFLILFSCFALAATPVLADYDYENENGSSTEITTTVNPRINVNPRITAKGGRGGEGGEGGEGGRAYSDAEASAKARALALSLAKGGAGGEATGVGSVVVEGDTFEPADLSKAPGTPADVGVDACAGGFSVSVPGAGVTGTKPSRFCHLLTIADVYQTLGERAVEGELRTVYLTTAHELREEARSNVKRRGRLTRALHLDEIPIIGWVLFRD